MILKKLTLALKCVNRIIIIILSIYLYNISTFANKYIINNVDIKIFNDQSIKKAKDQAIEEGAKQAFSLIAKDNKNYIFSKKIENYLSMVEIYEINNEEITDNYYKASLTYHLSDKSIKFFLNDKVEKIVIIPLVKFNEVEWPILEENKWYKIWNEELIDNKNFYLPSLSELEDIKLHKSSIIIDDASAFNNLIKTSESNCLIIAFADITPPIEDKNYFIRTKLKNFVIINGALKWQYDSKSIFKTGEDIELLMKESINSMVNDEGEKEIIINAAREKNE